MSILLVRRSLIEKPQGKHERSPNMLQLCEPCFLSAKSQGWFDPLTFDKKKMSAVFLFP